MGIISNIINVAVNTAILPVSIAHDIADKIVGEDSDHTENRLEKILTAEDPTDE